MLGSNSEIANSSRKCAEALVSLDERRRREIMAQLCFDRIDQKQEYLSERYYDTEDWNETAYFMLMRSLDIGANRHNYEQLARILPYRYLNLVRHNARSIMALLLGCSGLLDRLTKVYGENKDIAELKAIYDYDSHKYALAEMTISEWQLSGLKGDNHPIVRLLQVAAFIAHEEHLLDAMLGCRTPKDVERLLCNIDIPRWAYQFLSPESHSGAFSRAKAQMLGINVVAQLQIFYSEYTLRSDLDSRGIDLLEQLPAENNAFVRRWAKMGVVADNALESQALLQLSKGYCTSHSCDKCPLHRFLNAE